jgi:hypothetical protein
MTAPGGASGEDARDGGANPPDWAQTQAAWQVPGAPPGPPPPLNYPPYQQPGPAFGYPPPPGYGPPEYGGPPPGYGTPGYGPPRYPGGYYPTPDYQYQGAYGQQPGVKSGMNGMAIGSLIASLTGLLCCIGGVVGIVLGIVALDQIKKTRQDGYSIAVAGIVIGVATLIVALIVGIFAMHSS